jgi:hypothetical protein
MATINIDVDVQNNTVICGANGGNTRAHAGTVIVWKSRSEKTAFTLEFFQLALEGTRTHAQELRRWPFTEAEPKTGVVGPTSEFTGTLRGEDRNRPAYKYYVTVGNLRLDPIIIID